MRVGHGRQRRIIYNYRSGAVCSIQVVSPRPLRFLLLKKNQKIVLQNVE